MIDQAPDKTASSKGSETSLKGTGSEMKGTGLEMKGTGSEMKGTGLEMKGTGFSPYNQSANKDWALAPEGIHTHPKPRARVQAMQEYHPPLGDRDAMRLDFNENTVACSPKVREALGRISAGSLTRYPERAPVEAIVAAHLGVAPPQVALTNGVDEAIHVLFEAFLDEGDELLLPVPTYTMYEIYSSATDANVVAVQAADDLQFPFERLLAAITPRTKIVAIANPNSPSGSVATREQLIEIAHRAPQAVVLVDEAYFHFHNETVVDLIGVIPNLIVARTFSKAYGLAGLRLGLLAVLNPQ